MNGLKRSLLGGWESSGIALILSGMPPNPTLSHDNLDWAVRLRTGPIQPALTYPGAVTEWFNPADFAAPAPLAIGDAQEGAIRGPGRINFNISMFKLFCLYSEASNLRLSTEFCHAFNHTRFHDLNTSYGASALGRVTDTHDPRNIELSLAPVPKV